MSILRFPLLPIVFIAVIIFNFATGSWELAAILSIFLVYYLAVIRVAYSGSAALSNKPRLERLMRGVTQPSLLGLGLLAGGATILVAALSLGFTIGLAVAITVWVALLVRWLTVTYKFTIRRDK